MTARIRYNAIAALVVLIVLSLVWASSANGQTLQPPVVTRQGDTAFTALMRFVMPTTIQPNDSTRVKAIECVQVRRAGRNWREVCRQKTDRWVRYTGPVAPPPPPSTVSRVEINPKTVTIVTGGAWSFFAYAHWSSGTINDSSLTSGFTFNATGGTLAPSQNNAVIFTAGTIAGTFRVIARHATGKADTATVTVTPGTPTLSSVIVTPPSVSLLTGGQQQFSAAGQYSDGSSKALVAAWNASGGTINTGGLYTAGAAAGVFRVIGSDPSSGKADTSAVTLTAPQPPPPPGPYVPLVRKDWSTYPDKAALAGLIGVEGGLNDCTAVDSVTGIGMCAPILPATAFYDLVPDPLFGKVLRYNGGPHLNTTLKTRPGRVASHSVAIGSCTGLTPGASWYRWPQNGCLYPKHVWVRQYLRFSPNWTTASVTGGQNAADYKTMFLLYIGSSQRHEFIVHSLAGWWHSSGSAGATPVMQGQLPLQNITNINDMYGVQGFAYPPISAPGHQMVKTRSPTGNCQPPAMPCGLGDGEWYEIFMHHKTVGHRGEYTLYIRRYTQGGQINPGPWRITARFAEGSPGQQIVGVSRYVMGVNRNRQWDEVMHHEWGPYEIVDGAVYPNPWNAPCPAAGC